MVTLRNALKCKNLSSSGAQLQVRFLAPVVFFFLLPLFALVYEVPLQQPALLCHSLAPSHHEAFNPNFYMPILPVTKTTTRLPISITFHFLACTQKYYRYVLDLVSGNLPSV